MKNESPHKSSRNIIRSIEAEALRKRSTMAVVTDFLTSYFGTILFLISNILIYGAWVTANSGLLPNFPIVDPYPYSFMGSVISIEAIVLTVIVLMSQNRENQRDVLRQELSLQVELISEKEITKILRLLREIRAEQKGIKPDPELEEMIHEIDTTYIERKLTEQLQKADENILNKKL